MNTAAVAPQLIRHIFLPGIEPGERTYGLDELQTPGHPNHVSAAQSFFRHLGATIRRGEDTNSELRIYPLHDALGATRRDVEGTLGKWLSSIGWSYRIFGPDEEGHGWTNPDFGGASYHTKTVWIYQPADPRGSFRDYAYTLAWRVTHEIAHGLVNDDLTERYRTRGRRQGRLGMPRVWRAPGRETVRAEPLALADVLRALEWEHRTFPRQRGILEDAFDIAITDEAFAKENLINMADATYRALTGRFSSPGDFGVMPEPVNPELVLWRCHRLLSDAAEELEVQATRRMWQIGSGFNLGWSEKGEVRVAIPIPVAANDGKPIGQASWDWFEERLRKITGGFWRHPTVEGTWDSGAGICRGSMRLYAAIIPRRNLEALRTFLMDATGVFGQEAIFLEFAEVERVLPAVGAEARDPVSADLEEVRP